MKAAKLVVLRRNGREVLLVRRRRDGRWMFPGGRRLSRESLKDCLAREIAEELPELACAGCRFWRKLKGRNPYSGRRMSDAIFVGERAMGGLMIGDPAELDQVAWRRPWNLALTPTSRTIRDRLVREGLLRTR